MINIHFILLRSTSVEPNKKGSGFFSNTLKIITFLAFVLMLSTCKKEDAKVISSFPATMVIDTIQILEFDVYSKEGTGDEFDEMLAKPDYSKLSVFDSLVVINSTTGFRYNKPDSLVPNQSRKDRMDLFLAEYYFTSIPVDLPEVIIKIDTREELNYTFSENKDEITEAETKRFDKEGDFLVIELYSVGIYEKIPLPIEVYNVASQSGINTIDRNLLYQNLENNEIMVLTRYRILFKVH